VLVNDSPIYLLTSLVIVFTIQLGQCGFTICKHYNKTKCTCSWQSLFHFFW